MYESLGGRGEVNLTTSFDIKSCYETDLIEENKKQIQTQNNQINLFIKPFQILTLQVIPKK
jgi:alpha-mannosidase